MAFFNTNLHDIFFKIPQIPYPESKRRQRADLETERYLPINLRRSPKDFKLYSESYKKPVHDYILGNSTQKTLVSDRFFSQDNIDELHKLIRFTVYDQAGFVVDRQSDDDLLIIMMSMYKQYSTFPVTCNSKELQKEIDRLNLYVMRDAVPDIISNVKQYYSYLRDASLIAAPIPRPLGTSNTGTRELRSVHDVLSVPANPENASYGFTQTNQNFS